MPTQIEAFTPEEMGQCCKHCLPIMEGNAQNFSALAVKMFDTPQGKVIRCDRCYCDLTRALKNLRRKQDARTK